MDTRPEEFLLDGGRQWDQVASAGNNGEVMGSEECRVQLQGLLHPLHVYVLVKIYQYFVEQLW